MNDKRRKLWDKLKTDDRSFAWFHRTYLSDSGFKYNTLYKQAKGQELTEMSKDLESAIDKLLNGE